MEAPVMEHVVCFAPGDECELERFLAYMNFNRRDAGISISVLSIKSREKMVEKYIDLFPRLNIEIIPYPGSIDDYYSPNCVPGELKNRFSSKSHEGVVFLPGTPRKFRYMPNFFSPPLKQNYNYFRILKLVGIKKIYTFRLNSIMAANIHSITDDFVGIHKNRRCFIAGNGPSLKQLDISKLENEITFGSNRIYLGFNDWGFNFNYWCIVDSLQIEKYSREWENNIPDDTVKFYPFEYLNIFNMKNTCPVNFYPPGHPESPTNFNDPELKKELLRCPAISKDPDVVFLGHNTVYPMIQLAMMMGCNPICLVGVDHRFSLPEVDKKKGIWRDSRSSNHFHKDYTVNKEFHLPDMKQMTRFFDYAQQWAKQNGIEIYNATPDSALESFKKIEYDRLF
ncbi:MAG: hypothetical protein GY940_34695 [bacterium]|nr:hypothetical protein [bacterium]